MIVWIKAAVLLKQQLHRHCVEDLSAIKDRIGLQDAIYGWTLKQR